MQANAQISGVSLDFCTENPVVFSIYYVSLSFMFTSPRRDFHNYNFFFILIAIPYCTQGCGQFLKMVVYSLCYYDGVFPLYIPVFLLVTVVGNL